MRGPATLAEAGGTIGKFFRRGRRREGGGRQRLLRVCAASHQVAEIGVLRGCCVDFTEKLTSGRRFFFHLYIFEVQMYLYYF